MLYHTQTHVNDVSVLAGERNDVRHRSYSGKVRIARQNSLLIVFDRADELQRNADPCEILVRIAAELLLGIDDRVRLRQRQLSALVVIGYDEIDSELPRAGGLGNCGYSAVNANDKAYTACLQSLDGGRV